MATNKVTMRLDNGPLDEQEQRRNPFDDDEIEKAKRRQEDPTYPDDDKRPGFPF